MVECDKGLLLTHSAEHGSLFHVWSDDALAEQTCEKQGADYRVSKMSYRELGPQLTDMRNAGIKFVTINRGGENVRLVPIGDMLRVVEQTVAELDNGPLGTLFSQAH